MERKKFKRLTLFIGLTVLLTISVQFYRNVQIYKTNKRNVELEARKALDKAIEMYYLEIARIRMQEIMQSAQNLKMDLDTTDLSSAEILERIMFLYRKDIESTIISLTNKNSGKDGNASEHMAEYERKVAAFSMKYEISMNRVAFYLYPLLDELGIKDDVKLSLLEGGELVSGPNLNSLKRYSSVSTSQSTFLRSDRVVRMHYNIGVIPIFILGITDFTFSIAVISCILIALRTLYRMIYHQKELAVIKDDLLNNITHEFKTPIAAGISTLEGITLFNQDNDVLKNKKYAKLAIGEFNRMNELVEKFLETSSMQAGALRLKVEQLNLTHLVKEVIKNHRDVNSNKNLKTDIEKDVLWLADKFYLEMALGNLIDNALKYGGDTVYVSLRTNEKGAVIEVMDNGDGIDMKHRDHIFEKFYRIPKGNLHNVKGYGIGLYSARKIVDQHEGKLEMEIKNGLTIFRITFQ